MNTTYFNQFIGTHDDPIRRAVYPVLWEGPSSRPLADIMTRVFLNLVVITGEVVPHNIYHIWREGEGGGGKGRWMKKASLQSVWKLTNFPLPQVRGFQLEYIGLQKPDNMYTLNNFQETTGSAHSQVRHTTPTAPASLPTHLLECPSPFTDLGAIIWFKYGFYL